MEEQLQAPAQPRRRRKTRMEIIKEAYLPYLFLLIATVLVIIFIIGALVRDSASKDAAPADGDTGVPTLSQFTTGNHV